MPLSPPQERELLHSRDIVLRGYRRADGNYDIEAQLTDTKSYGFANRDRGYVAAGEPIHGMWLRLTVDDQRRIVACEAASDHTPYTVCPAAAPNFARLAGLQIKPGFLKEAARRVGGTLGCTHLRELLQQMATTAYQTIDPARAKREADAEFLGPLRDGGGCGRRGRRSGQRPARHAHRRQDGRRAGDPEHLHRLRHGQSGGAAALAAALYRAGGHFPGRLSGVARVVAVRGPLQWAVIGRLMARRTGRLAEILQHEDAHRAGAAAAVAGRLDLADQPVDVLPLARADLGKRVPQLGFQTHTGAAAPRHDVPIDQSTAWHGCPPV